MEPPSQAQFWREEYSEYSFYCDCCRLALVHMHLKRHLCRHTYAHFVDTFVVRPIHLVQKTMCVSLDRKPQAFFILNSPTDSDARQHLSWVTKDHSSAWKSWSQSSKCRVVVISFSQRRNLHKRNTFPFTELPQLGRPGAREGRSCSSDIDWHTWRDFWREGPGTGFAATLGLTWKLSDWYPQSMESGVNWGSLHAAKV